MAHGPELLMNRYRAEGGASNKTMLASEWMLGCVAASLDFPGGCQNKRDLVTSPKTIFDLII
jgi:hypothetical protein